MRVVKDMAGTSIHRLPIWCEGAKSIVHQESQALALSFDRRARSCREQTQGWIA
jgi:hypothetical protein